MIRGLMVTAAALALAAPHAADAQSREQIRVVGSSTVYPFTTAVAERFARETDFDAPLVESTGTGGGFQLFCEGVGLQTPDINNASRAMTASERETCASNGVDSVTEIQIGNDGIVLAADKSAAPLEITRAQLWLALAQHPVVDDAVQDENPFQRWSDIHDSLPDQEIVVFGPPTTSGTRDAFVELAMEAGCARFEAVMALDESRMEEVCVTMREDGGFVEAGENDNVIVDRLQSQPGSRGIFGYSFFDQNRDTLDVATIEGAQPTPEAIGGDEYPLARPLFIYVKDQHVGVIPGLGEFLDYYTSPEVWGPNGFLIDSGLIPMTENRRETVADAVDAIL